MDVQPKTKKTACGETFAINYTTWEDMPERTIYEKILKLCACHGLNLKEAAKKAGIAYGTIRLYNKYVQEPNPLILQKFASAFDKDIRYFIDFDLEKLSDRIRYFRIINGYMVKELARTLGVIKDTITTWEKGNNIPDPVNLEKLKCLFGKSFEEF